MNMNLNAKALKIRRLIIKMIAHAGSGHPGGSLSIVEILSALFFGGNDVGDFNPKNPKRDKFILAKGHSCPTLYAVYALKKWIQQKELWTLRQPNSRLQGHPEKTKLPILETSSGSLGQGLSVGIGMALSSKLDKMDNRIFVLMSDGEQQEGQTMEAIMTAAHYKLDNLIGIIDMNKLQSDGAIENIKSLGNLKKRYKNFGWETFETDGHNIKKLIRVIQKARKHYNGKPKIILAHTIKGKGVSFMENKAKWHAKQITMQDKKRALEELSI